MDQSVVDLSDQQIDNAEQFLITQRVEQNNLVQPVQEFRIEDAFHLAEHQFIEALRRPFFRGGLESHGGAFLEMPRAEVRGHDQNRVPEIHGIAEAVGELAVFKYLEQNIVDVGVSLLDFVEQDHRVRRAANALCQLAAFFVAHISWRRADQLGHGMFFHVFGHIETHQ